MIFTGSPLPGPVEFNETKPIQLPDLYERLSPSSTSFIFLRERYIDDVLKASLNDGLDQVVILGAGFDTRPYLITGIEKTHVFKIDFPATQETNLNFWVITCNRLM